MALAVTGARCATRSYLDFKYYRSANSGHDGARCHNKAVRLFEYVAIKAAKMVHGDPWKIMIAFISLLRYFLEYSITYDESARRTHDHRYCQDARDTNLVPFLMTQILA